MSPSIREFQSEPGNRGRKKEAIRVECLTNLNVNQLVTMRRVKFATPELFGISFLQPFLHRCCVYCMVSQENYPRGFKSFNPRVYIYMYTVYSRRAEQSRFFAVQFHRGTIILLLTKRYDDARRTRLFASFFRSKEFIQLPRQSVSN